MKAEVIYTSSLHLSDTDIDVEIIEVSEILLFDCSLPDQEAVVIPCNKAEPIVLTKGDFKTCFHDAKSNLISFALSKPLKIDGLPGQSWQTMTFNLMNLDGNLSASKTSKSEFYIFLDFCFKNFHGMDIQQMKNSKEFSSQNVYQGAAHLKWWLRPYVYFLNHYQNQLNERQWKNLLRSQENLPEFLRDILMIDDLTIILATLHLFFMNHICRNGKCAKTTHKKCSACRLRAYCCDKCQTESWAKHEAFCKRMVIARNRYEIKQKTILYHLKKQFPQDTLPVSIKNFQQELGTAMFVLFCPIIEETNSMDNWMNFCFSEKPRSFWVDEIKSLLKKEYVPMREKLNVTQVISQVSATWSLEERVDLENFIKEWVNELMDRQLS